MSKDIVPLGKQRRSQVRKYGRPPIALKQNLADDLVMAVESTLRDKSHLDLTTREIASNAGAQIAMIHYYFDSKDGLVFAALDRLSQDIANSLTKLEQDLRCSMENATQRIIETWIGIHRRHHRITSISLIESFRPESYIWQRYSERMTTHTQSFPRMRKIVQLLMDRGYYRADADVELLAFAIVSLVHSPHIVGSVLSRLGHDIEAFTGDPWIKLSVRMLEREFRPLATDEAGQAT